MIGQRLRDLVTSLDPNYTLDADAEEQVLELADDFLEKVTKQSMRLAQHRGSKTLDVSDIQLVLAKQWGIVIPGLGAPNMRPTKPDNRVVAGAQVSTVPGANNNTKRQMSSDSTGTLLNESAAKKAKIPATGASSISTKATM
jgi:transcription initiation factor TFIID subunit TAF12